MASSSRCLNTFLVVVRRVEPLVVLAQLGTSLFDTALLMVVKDRCANATYPLTDAHVSREDDQQRAMSDFYMVNNLIIQLTPIVPAVLLAKAGDKGWRRAPVAVPLCGYLLSSVALLLVVVLKLPIQVMFAAAVFFGISGGFCAYWPGVMTLVSLGSTTETRSQVMMRVELMYGVAGLLGSLLSGHVFLLYSSSVGYGTVLLCICALLHLLSLIHATVLLQVRQVLGEPDDSSSRLLPQSSNSISVDISTRRNMVIVILLFSAAILYGSSVGGAVEILGIFVLKEPLHWTAMQVGYGNMAGFVIFLSSFLGAIVFRRCVSEVTLILIGMLSFASGIYLMSFVTTSYMFYLARSLSLFALIPLPTIRSLLSQQVPTSLWGITLTALQLALRFAALAYIPAFTKLYQRTLGWSPGFVFMLSSILAVLGMIPISVVGFIWSRSIRPVETEVTPERNRVDKEN
ncbi:thymic stromal cotransporter homolog [Corythoichthys intestinalis]|uniref:thymic stromal cotransporter homolog n=1 Tax=Corythoichthys intestinalis TaxID=161448 RepID=UPI0025A5B14F|nr:thymic stromal cotransporter homolog [Corythoichthys intestinalis]XP_061800475.1 solute carrier family 46 member 2 [Nerophis lumbriciformis]